MQLVLTAGILYIYIYIYIYIHTLLIGMRRTHEVAPCDRDHWGSVVELAAATRTFVGAPKRPWPRGGLRWCSLWARETCETLRDAAWQMQKIHNKWWSLRNPRAQALLANSYMGLGRAGPLRLGHNLSKTSLDLQKQFPNTKFHLKFVQFWAVVHLPHSGPRNSASLPEWQASLG